VNTPVFGDSKSGLGNDDFRTGIFTAADFPLPTAGSLGTLGRNTFRGPRYFSTDVSLFKNVEVPWFGARDATLQLRVEAFNVFDTVNFANFGLANSNVASTVFGRATAALPSREVQLGVKFIF
jgi:hypothetical protein